jgi:hypothetical protein
MKFDILGLVMMIISVGIGQLLGSMVEGVIGGYVGGTIGTLLAIVAVGMVIYAVFTLVTGGKLDLMTGLIFAVIVYIANMIAGYIASMTGFGGGIVSLVAVGFIASLIWGYVGGKKAAAQTPIKV